MGMTHILLYAIVPIVVIMLLGFASGKRGVFTGEDSKKFNMVVLDYALPAALFVSIVQSSRSMLYAELQLALVSLVVIMGCFMLVYVLFARCFKGNTGADGAVSALISGSPSIGFLGFAVLEPIFGTSPAVALVVAVISIVVNAVGIPVGLSLLNASTTNAQKQGQKQSAWLPVLHALKQPVAWAPLLAVVMVVVGVPWPPELSPSFNLIAQANASLAVFSAGITLSVIHFEVSWQAILGSIMKLIVMPAAALGVGLLCRMDPLNLKMLVVACALPPAFSGIIIADEYNEYVAEGTSSLTLSVILFVAFCPLWIWITDAVLKYAA